MLFLIPQSTIGNTDYYNAESVWIVFRNHYCYGNPPPKVLTLYYKESVKGFLFTSVGFSHAFIHII